MRKKDVDTNPYQMRPAYRFAAISACFAAGAMAAFVAMARVFDSGMVPGHGEAVGWTIAYALLLAVTIWLYVKVEEDGTRELQYTGAMMPCQSQRNSQALVTAYVWINGSLLVLCFLSAIHVVRLRDALVAAAALGGPVSTIWYWAAAHPYQIVPFTPAEKSKS